MLLYQVTSFTIAIHADIIKRMEENNRLVNSPALLAAVRRAFPDAAARDARQLNALVLAYIGDTVYDLFVRSYLVEISDSTVRGLHLQSASLVCACAQAEAFRRWEPLLTEEEMGIYKRGGNAHMGTVPKNASIADYRVATGLEALAGYLYLTGRDARLAELMRLSLLQKHEKEDKQNGTN